jgi:hypothetical protein
MALTDISKDMLRGKFWVPVSYDGDAQITSGQEDFYAEEFHFSPPLIT